LHLFPEEREARKPKTSSITSEISHESNVNTPRFRRAVKKVSSQSKILHVFNADNDDTLALNEGSFITEHNTGPFRRAVDKVTKQNTRVMNETSKITNVYEAVVNQHNQQHHYSKMQHDQTPNEHEIGNELPPVKKQPLALMNIADSDLRLKVREELQENIEVMIRKLAEIQHVENMRRYEQELQEAAQRIFRAQDRENDIKRMSMELKRQLQEELMFRDATRVPRDTTRDVRDDVGERKIVQSANAAIQTNESIAMGNDTKSKTTENMESITAAKKAGSEWKGKAKKSRKTSYSKKDAMYSSQRKEELTPRTPQRTQSETFSRDIVKEIPPQPRSAQNLDAVMKELEQEKEWRRKAEISMKHQREMIEDLRKGIQGDVQRLIEEQNNRYQELKATLATYENAKNIRSETRSEPRSERRSLPESLKKKPNNWKQEGDDVSIVNHDDGDDCESDGVRTDDDDNDDDDSHDEYSSPPRTPEYYIK